MSFLSSYLAIVEHCSHERQLSGSSYSQFFEMTIGPNTIPAIAKESYPVRCQFGPRRKSQRTGSTYSNSSVKKRASKVQLVPESTQKSNIVARTGRKPKVTEEVFFFFFYRFEDEVTAVGGA